METSEPDWAEFGQAQRPDQAGHLHRGGHRFAHTGHDHLLGSAGAIGHHLGSRARKGLPVRLLGPVRLEAVMVCLGPCVAMRLVLCVAMRRHPLALQPVLQLPFLCIFLCLRLFLGLHGVAGGQRGGAAQRRDRSRHLAPGGQGPFPVGLPLQSGILQKALAPGLAQRLAAQVGELVAQQGLSLPGTKIQRTGGKADAPALGHGLGAAIGHSLALIELYPGKIHAERTLHLGLEGLGQIHFAAQDPAGGRAACQQGPQVLAAPGAGRLGLVLAFGLGLVQFGLVCLYAHGVSLHSFADAFRLLSVILPQIGAPVLYIL